MDMETVLTVGVSGSSGIMSFPNWKQQNIKVWVELSQSQLETMKYKGVSGIYRGYLLVLVGYRFLAHEWS